MRMKTAFLASGMLAALAVPTSLPAEQLKTMWNGAGTGGIHVPGAEVTPEQASVSLFGSYFLQDGLVSPADEASRLRYGLGGVVSPFKPGQLDPFRVEFGLALGGSSTTNDLGNPETLDSFGDLALSAKGVYRVNEAFGAGIRARLILPYGVSGESGYGDTAGYAGEALASWRSGDFVVHGAAGFLYDRTINFVDREPTGIERFAWGQTDYNQVTFGLSFNYETELIDYLVEASGEVPVGENAPAFAAAPLRVTPGLRIRPWNALEVHVAADIGLTGESAQGVPAQPNWDALAAVRWLFDFGTRPAIAEADSYAPTTTEAEPEPQTPPASEATPSVEAPAPTTEPTTVIPRGGLQAIVRTPEGDPVSGATIRLQPEGAGSETDASGSVSFESLSPGPVTLEVSAPGRKAARTTTRIEAGETRSLEITLEPMESALELTVRDQSGKPVPDVAVTIDGNAVGRTDNEGRLTVSPVTQGRRDVRVEKDGFEAATVTTTVAEGSRSSIELAMKALPRPGYVEIKVLNEAREPIMATVTFEGHPDLKRTLDPAKGSETLYKLTPGTYKIRVEAVGYEAEEREFRLAEDGDLALRFRLSQ